MESSAKAPATRRLAMLGRTEAALGVLERVEGEVHTVSGDVRQAARAASEILSGQGIETGRGASLAVLKFPDGTRLELLSDPLGEMYGNKVL